MTMCGLLGELAAGCMGVPPEDVPSDAARELTSNSIGEKLCSFWKVAGGWGGYRRSLFENSTIPN